MLLDQFFANHARDYFYLCDGHASFRVCQGLKEILVSAGPEAISVTRSDIVLKKNEMKILTKILRLFTHLAGSRLLAVLRNTLQPSRRAKSFSCAEVEEIFSRIYDEQQISAKYVKGGLVKAPFSTIEIRQKNAH